MTTTINYNAGDTVQIKVDNVDNCLQGYLEESGTLRRQVYGRMTDHGGAVGDTVDLTASLRDPVESLSMVGSNFGGSGQFTFAIVVNGEVQAHVDENLGRYTSHLWQFVLRKV